MRSERISALALRFRAASLPGGAREDRHPRTAWRYSTSAAAGARSKRRCATCSCPRVRRHGTPLDAGDRAADACRLPPAHRPSASDPRVRAAAEGRADPHRGAASTDGSSRSSTTSHCRWATSSCSDSSARGTSMASGHAMPTTPAHETTTMYLASDPTFGERHETHDGNNDECTYVEGAPARRKAPEAYTERRHCDLKLDDRDGNEPSGADQEDGRGGGKRYEQQDDAGTKRCSSAKGPMYRLVHGKGPHIAKGQDRRPCRNRRWRGRPRLRVALRMRPRGATTQSVVDRASAAAR